MQSVFNGSILLQLNGSNDVPLNDVPLPLACSVTDMPHADGAAAGGDGGDGGDGDGGDDDGSDGEGSSSSQIAIVARGGCG